MEQVIRRLTTDEVWQRWTEANSPTTTAAKSGCISAHTGARGAAPAGKSGCIS
ncbi:hypothetical protein ACN20G_33145 (plasmid) [Streptomyces sp. BI20]|uniref:hypothetical protein n=1 Tax=Streptomyces sp. BI20 TaxID=3403460 RepID=UPI003C712413